MKIKKVHFSVKQRLNHLQQLKLSNVTIDYWPGKAVDYLKQHNTNYIVRGYRDQKSLNYEMNLKSQYQKANSSIITKIYKTKTKVSSTKVRYLIKQGVNINHLVPWKSV